MISKVAGQQSDIPCSAKQSDAVVEKKHSAESRFPTAIAVLIFAAEIFIMLLLFTLPPFSVLVEVLIGSLLLAVLLAPILYIFLFRPLRLLASKYQQIESELKKHQNQDGYLESSGRQHTPEPPTDDIEPKGKTTEHSWTEEGLHQHVKLLNCFYRLSRIIEQPQVSLEHIFEETVNLVRNTYQYPDSTCARITFNGIQYKTDNFEKSELSQRAQIMVHGNDVGTIDVYYIGDKPKSGESLFLNEERDLLEAVAERLGSVAEHKKATARMQLFRNLIDRSNDCIFAIEPKWGRILDVNERACETLGYKRKELLNMTFKDIEETITDDVEWQELVQELKLKTDIIRQTRHRRKNGETFFTETSLKHVSQEGEDYIVAIARDITERKRAEEHQAQLLEEVESANRELKDFAHIVSHDLKAPLRGIKTLTNWISADCADKLSEKSKEQMELLLGRVDRMHNLIDGVLQYSRVGRTKENLVQVKLNELVPNIIDMLAPPENVEVTIGNQLPVIECDETRITQVFQNLLSNAIKYMDKPKGRIKINCVEEDDFWKFSVADSGPGIEEKDFEKVFQIFKTLSARDDFESTGVGLTVVKKIVELYHGKIWVQSTPGQGTTFFFTMPKQKQQMEIENEKFQANIVG